MKKPMAVDQPKRVIDTDVPQLQALGSRPFPLDPLCDGGKRETFASGAIREPRTGKGRFDLIPPESLLRLAKHFELGAFKYAERNWEKGLSCARCFSSAVGHLFSYAAGNRDEDHLAAACWNIFVIMSNEDKRPDTLDLPGQK